MLTFNAVNAVAPIQSVESIELGGPKYDAFDLVKETRAGINQYMKVGDVYYVNADTLDVACDEERVGWYKKALEGKADFEEINDEAVEGEYTLRVYGTIILYI